MRISEGELQKEIKNAEDKKVKDFARILHELTGYAYACEVDSIADWLKEICELRKSQLFCPDEIGIYDTDDCWIQFIEHYDEKDAVFAESVQKAIDVLETEKRCVLQASSYAPSPCNRDCNSCELVLPEREIIKGLDTAIGVLQKAIEKYKKGE